MIGEDKFCLDPKTYKIFTATEIGRNITETGYVMVRLMLKDKTTTSLESAHVHDTSNGAEDHRMRVQGLIESANAIIDEAKEKVDAIRIQVIGEPEFLDFAEMIRGINANR